MDLETAYSELCRFADAAGIELPDLEEIQEKQAEAELDEDKEEPEDYMKLREAIASGQLLVHEDGSILYNLIKPAIRAKKLEIDPATWPYAKALRAFHSNVRGKKGQRDTLGGLYAYMERLGGVPRHALMEMTCKRDCDVVTALANLLLGE